jgi:hypothetical protein
MSSPSDPSDGEKTPPVVKMDNKKVLMGEQSIGGTVYIRPELETTEEVVAPKSLDSSFARQVEETKPPVDDKKPDAPGFLTKVRSKEEEEVDEELKMAQALALAIQSNPTMSPDEIKQLIGVHNSNNEKPAVSTTAAASNNSNNAAQLQAMAEKQQQAILAAGQKFSSMLQTAVDASSENAKKASNQGQETFKALTKSLSSFKPPVNIKWTTTSSSTATSSKEASLSEDDAEGSMNVTDALDPPSTSHLVSKSIQTVTTDIKGAATSAYSSPQPKSSSYPSQRPALDTTTASFKPSNKAERVRLSGLAWKRRGGMGKYTSSAWEQRRFQLVGPKLFYFHNNNDDGAAAGDVIMEQRSDSPQSIVTASSEDKDTEGVHVTRRSTWFEQATTSWTATLDPSSPRGCLDLAKEKATVQVSFGHSGAPSPFALSIKVGGDTKWKLCFDQHKTLMTWLTALSDVVVQCSVDSYNASLLAAADPSNHVDGVTAAILLLPVVNRPPGSEKDGNRLWMCEEYRIQSVPSGEGNQIFVDDATVSSDADEVEEDGSEIPSTGTTGSVSDDAVVDHSAARAVAQEMSDKVWSIPEHNLYLLAGILNAALIFARSSSISSQGFWYILILVNIGLYQCMVKEPAWKSLLEHVNANSGCQTLENNPGVRRRSKKTALVAPAPRAATVVEKPIAGTTTIKLKEIKDPPVNALNQIFAGWRSVSGESVQVRSHGYNSTKAKVPSPGELYELVNVDIFESPSRYPDMATRVILPERVYDDGGKPKTWRTPDTFVISIALPTDPPSAFAKTSSDGSGYTITMYYKMHQDTRDILRRVTADGYDPSQEKPDDPQKSKVNAARLMEEWVRRAPTDPKYQARFKVVTTAHNLDEIGMPSWISKYNGKPFLVKRAGVTGFLFNHPELSCMEFDVSLHAFPYLCKQAICFMKDSYFKKILVTFGFTIEGRTDDEVRSAPNVCKSFFTSLDLTHLWFSFTVTGMCDRAHAALLPRSGVCNQGRRFLFRKGEQIILGL